MYDFYLHLELILLALEGCAATDCPPEACGGYFDPISCEYECLGLLTNQNQEWWHNVWLSILINANIFLHPSTPLQLLLLQSLGKGSKSQLLSSTELGLVREDFPLTTLLRELILGCSDLCVLSLHYKSLGRPCDLRKGRLDTRPFTSPIQWNFSGKRAVTPLWSPARLKMSKSRELG